MYQYYLERFHVHIYKGLCMFCHIYIYISLTEPHYQHNVPKHSQSSIDQTDSNTNQRTCSPSPVVTPYGNFAKEMHRAGFFKQLSQNWAQRKQVEVLFSALPWNGRDQMFTKSICDYGICRTSDLSFIVTYALISILRSMCIHLLRSKIYICTHTYALRIIVCTDVPVIYHTTSASKKA